MPDPTPPVPEAANDASVSQARVPGATARRARAGALIQRAAAALASTMDRDRVLDTIVATSMEALGAAAGAVTELTDDASELRVVSSVGYPDALVRRFGVLRVQDHPIVGHMMRERAPVLLESQEIFERLAPTIASQTSAGGARAAIPLATTERFLGILALTFPAPRTFDDEDRELLQVLAHHCAVALERARLFALERSARAQAEWASAQLAEALERMSDLHFVCDESWRYTRVNRAMRDFLAAAGIDAETLIGRVIWDVFPRLVGGEMHAAMLRAAREGVAVPFSARGSYADSWYEGSAYPLVGAVAVHARDTTERRRAEREVARLATALTERVEEMETLLRVIPVGIGIATDAACEEVVINPALAQLLGVPPTTNASKSGPGGAALPFRVLRDGEEVPVQELPLQLAARTGEAVPHRDFDIEREGGSRVTLLESAVPIFDAEGKVRGSVGAFVDVTDRKRAEEASRILADASAAFASSLDVAQTFTILAQRVVPTLADVCTIFVVRENGSVGVAALTCSDPPVLDALRDFDRLHPVDLTPSHPVWRALREGRSILVPTVDNRALAAALSGEQPVLQLAHETGTTSLLLVPLQARGQVLGAMGLGTRGRRRHFDARDQGLVEELGRRAGQALDNARLLAAELRARREAEEAHRDAERASQSKSAFLAMMSHELRTPLNAIAGYAELLELGLRGPVTEEQVTDLNKIRRNQRHLLGLIDSVLSFARLESGRVTYDVTDVPVTEALATASPLVEPQIGARDHRLVIAECPPEVTVRADPEKLQQILLNLLGNAAKFTPNGGRIEVLCEVQPARIAIHVRDSGVGIPDNEIDTIFEPFVQSNRTVRNFREGVGLGLAISRELTQGMGGELAVASAIDAGSTFTLRLPRGADRGQPA